MSGIVGVVNLDGAPVDPRLLARLTHAMAFRGPDREALRVGGPVGFGQALLQTGPLTTALPTSRDRPCWIAADARLDGRADLRRALETGGCTRLEAACDARLILCAYEAWGDACLDRLRGDFAFAIWDAEARRLFCARDQLGAKPFYYARVGASIIFSNTLGCVRMHPAVDANLDDHAIGDFLLFGYNRHLDRTSFAAVQRLPPAHALACSVDGRRIWRRWRYWELPQPQIAAPAPEREVVEKFRETFRAAASDRLGADAIGVLMSGGLDSTSVAAMAHGCRARARMFALRAHCVTYEGVVPDRERPYAAVAARSFGMPIEFVEARRYELFETAGDTPEPSDNPLPAMTAELFRSTAAHARVALTGEGGDAVLSGPSAAYFVDLLRRDGLSTLARTAMTALCHGRVPPLRIRTRVRRLAGIAPPAAVYPPWIAPRLEARINLRDRWQAVEDEATRLSAAPLRAWRELQSPFWPYLLESYDAGVTGVPLECRHPFLDLRVIACLLGVRPAPWLMDKLILRRAMRGLSPRAVRLRRKTPLAADPAAALLRRPEARHLNMVSPHAELLEYVDLAKMPGFAQALRPLCLNQWLASAANHGAARKEWVDGRIGAEAR